MVRRFVGGGLERRSLLFGDEMGTRTSLAPSYGYSPRGQRAFFKAPRNRGTNTTLLSSMSLEGMGPSVAIEVSRTKEVLEAYIEHYRGCHLFYLLPYSPDLKPIEEAFSKLRRLLRVIGARTKEALVDAIGKARDAGRPGTQEASLLIAVMAD